MDWKALIQKLIDAGLTQMQIASACGVRQSSVSDLYRGKSESPNFDFGMKLVKLADAQSPSMPDPSSAPDRASQAA